MKTTIHTDLEIPQEALDAARREALRTNRTLGAVLSEWVAKKAEQITKAMPA